MSELLFALHNEALLRCLKQKDSRAFGRAGPPAKVIRGNVGKMLEMVCHMPGLNSDVSR